MGINPIRHTRWGWYWGHSGPWPTREKAVQIARAAHAHGFRENPDGEPVFVKTRKCICGGNLARIFSGAGDHLLFICERCGRVYQHVQKNPLESELYESFHGTKPIRARRIVFITPKGPLIKAGKITRLEYAPDFPSRFRNTLFYHDSGDTGTHKRKTNLILATDLKGKNLYLIKDDPKSKYPYFSDKGIIG